MRVGVDPGIHGAIAFVDDNIIKFFDMPTMTIPWAVTTRYKTMVDAKKIYRILKSCPYDIESINIEIVGAMPGQGISSTGVLFGALYSAISAVRIFGIEPNMIRPGKWKKKFGLINRDKDDSRLAVLQMYPNLQDQLKRKKDVDRAEALLIAVS